MESIEIILKKDSKGNDVNLNNMSLNDSKSIREILDALIRIAEYETDLGLKIGLEKGSAAHKLIGSHENLTIVYSKIEDAANNSKNRDNLYIDQLNIIHKNFKKFNDVEVFYNSKDFLKKDIKHIFNRRFRKRRVKSDIENNFHLKFFNNATLQQNGGLKPNFHLTYLDDSYTIQCSKEEAQKVNRFLYNEIKISAWVIQKKHKVIYTFCDLYVGNSSDYFDRFNKFIKELKKKKGTESFHFISKELERFYNENNYAGANKFIRLFLNELATPSYLRTILVISKGFKNHEEMKNILAHVEKRLFLKIGKVY